MAIVMGLLAPHAGLTAEASYTAAQYAELEERMATWVQALRDKHVERFLACYSKLRPSFYQSTLTRPQRKETIAYKRLEADLKGKTGWYEVFFDAGGDDVFRDHAVDDGSKRWHRHGVTFTPPHPDAAGSVFVRWRRERGVWVIDRVAEPSA